MSVAHYTGYLEKSLIGIAINEFTEPNWDEINERYIVENAIPLTILEDNADQCVLEAKFLDRIIDHAYFKRGDELAKKLNYDRENETITVNCSVLNYTKSKLVIWYVVEEAPTHSKKYQYWIIPWEETSIEKGL